MNSLAEQDKLKPYTIAFAVKDRKPVWKLPAYSFNVVKIKL